MTLIQGYHTSNDMVLPEQDLFRVVGKSVGKDSSKFECCLRS